jgi:hypothetical protein
VILSRVPRQNQPTGPADRVVAKDSVLHLLSKDRQVILFTQEEDVLSWAEQNLVGANDRVERLQ